MCIAKYGPFFIPNKVVIFRCNEFLGFIFSDNCNSQNEGDIVPAVTDCPDIVPAAKEIKELLQPKRGSEENSQGTPKRLKPDVSDVDPLDIGQFVTMPQELDDMKFDLIINHWKPPESYKFP